jgi:hypothetical protein
MAGMGGDERKPHKLLRKCVDPKFVYLDGVRGYVVNVQVRYLLFEAAEDTCAQVFLDFFLI